MPKKCLSLLKAQFDQYDIDGYIIPSTDEYQSEYTAPYARRLECVTGFTGSNGIAIILKDKSLFFTDGRYIDQAARELDQNEFEIYNITEISEYIPALTLGLDDMLFTERQLSCFDKATLKAIDVNLVDAIWSDQPEFPISPIFAYKEEYAGLAAEIKLQGVRSYMKRAGGDYLLLTSLDSICWLLNIRASDIPYCPMLLSYLVISHKEMWLFIEDRPFESIILDITIKPRAQIKAFLSGIVGKVIVDKKTVPLGLFRACKDVISGDDPCTLPKACKHEVEINGSKSVHIKDAIALCEALAWVEEEAPSGNLSEYDISEKLTDYRKQQEGYVSDSFAAIVGYQENGAIIHYRAPESSSKLIKGEGVLLIDSGGHYLGGTTDVTRTINIGTPTNEQKLRYTQVLKGHLNLARQKFVPGTSGGNLDVLARMYLWQDRVDYAHGTGHGVGNMLSVHEGPQNISRFSTIALQKNMIVSNEPGFYKSGSYGIRIENLQYVTESDSGFLQFETLTLVPYCKELIDLSFLTKDEMLSLQHYQKLIILHVYPHLSSRAKEWVDKNLI
jgi:Xaa-Pro aminopeptidase